MAATETGRRPRWALPPKPPEKWIGGLWSALLVAGLALAILVPLTQASESSSHAVPLAILHAAIAAAALLAGHALLIEDSVRGDHRLRWAAAGLASVYGLLLVRSVTGFNRVGDALTFLILAAVPLYAITRGLSRHSPRLLAAPAAALAAGAAAAFLLRRDIPDLVGDPRWAAPAALSVLGLAVWRGVRRPHLWISICLVLTAAAGVVRTLEQQQYDALWWVGLGLESAAFAMVGAGAGLHTAWGYGRQSRRWRQLETDVRALKTASPLLPGRSVTPDDDEGLPGMVELRVLIDAGLVRVAIQPVVELATGRVVGHEALSRFGGRVPTDRWFKAASVYGLGGELERVTLYEALTLLPGLPSSEFLAVNISPAALSDVEVMRLLDTADLSRVVVEITEHEAVADYKVTRVTLDRLRRAGARIAVDDTGAGFASLRHVLMLQPDLIKLDTSLTRGIETDKRQQDLVRAVTDFAAQVGADVLAEGIETQGQLDELRGIGVGLGQGWHLGVPVIGT